MPLHEISCLVLDTSFLSCLPLKGAQLLVLWKSIYYAFGGKSWILSIHKAIWSLIPHALRILSTKGSWHDLSLYSNQMSNVFTKALPTNKFWYFCSFFSFKMSLRWENLVMINDCSHIFHNEWECWTWVFNSIEYSIVKATRFTLYALSYYSHATSYVY